MPNYRLVKSTRGSWPRRWHASPPPSSSKVGLVPGGGPGVGTRGHPRALTRPPPRSRQCSRGRNLGGQAQRAVRPNRGQRSGLRARRNLAAATARSGWSSDWAPGRRTARHRGREPGLTDLATSAARRSVADPAGPSTVAFGPEAGTSSRSYPRHGENTSSRPVKTHRRVRRAHRARRRPPSRRWCDVRAVRRRP